MMIIRQELAKDFEEIYELVKIAFQTAKVSNSKEQDFVNQLRSSNGYIPELALVAGEDDKLVGHIMLTKTYIVNGNSKFETLLLAPLSVVLEYRNKGIGAQLINESFRLAQDMGYTSIFLVGDPAYYHRFGFKSSVHFGITQIHNIPEENVMGCELIPTALRGISGIIDL